MGGQTDWEVSQAEVAPEWALLAPARLAASRVVAKGLELLPVASIPVVPANVPGLAKGKGSGPAPGLP
jgi:hypothetical protein